MSILFLESRSHDNFSTSPVKSQTSLSSPISKVSSGFSSRSSTDTIGDLDGKIRFYKDL